MTQQPQHPDVVVRRAGDYERSKYYRICVTGLSGSGKTVLGCTVPTGVTLVAEKIALPTIRQWNPDQHIIEVSSREDVYNVLWWARDSQEAKQYETLVLDSATEIATYIKRWVAERSPDRVKLDKAGLKGALSLSDWGVYYDECDRLMRALTRLPMHTLALAGAFEETDNATRMRYLRPNFEGQKFPPRFPGYFSLSGVIEVVPKQGGGVDRQVVFEAPGGRYLVKGARGLGVADVPDVASWIERMDTAQENPGVAAVGG